MGRARSSPISAIACISISAFSRASFVNRELLSIISQQGWCLLESPTHTKWCSCCISAFPRSSLKFFLWNFVRSSSVLLCFVTFGLNVRLDLSGKATTKSLCLLQTELLLKVLCESTWTVTIRVIRGDEGVGDIPGVQGGSGGSVGSAQYSSIDTRTQT